MKSALSEKIIILTSIFVSLIFTPVNFDALIIPKLALIFSLASYLVPQILGNYKLFLQNYKLKCLSVISILIITQMIIVMIRSEAPFAQEFYGRTGRALGFSTFFSMAIILLFMAINSKLESSKNIIIGLCVSALLSSSYALLQRFNLDPFNWNSRTNGVIGTLGNPNFQSAFAAMAIIPTFVYFWNRSYRYIFSPVAAVILMSVIYFTQSTQGYVIISAALLVYAIIFFWYKNKFIASSIAVGAFISSLVAINGMLNQGPLAPLLYKVSVQSRGDFWRSAFGTANSNPIFGVGIDSFGDSFLIYRDMTAFNHTFGEITDNAHNYFLEFAATGGYPLAILHLLVILLTFSSFVSLQITLKKFNPQIAALFSAWLAFQMQSIISPGTLVLILWNTLISGYFIGSSIQLKENINIATKKPTSFLPIKNYFGIGLLVCSLFIMYPLFNSDRTLMKGIKARDANLVMSSLTSFPESSVKYNIFGQEILRSNLPDQALEIAKDATRFNPNAVSAWALIFSNPKASKNELLEARNQILRLDPLNQEVFKFNIK
jgi:O-antigen ligase